MGSVNEDDLEKLLRLTKILERYEYYLLRRSIGNFYIGIVSIVATTIFLFVQMISVFGVENPYIISLPFVVMITLIIALRISLFRFKIFIRIPKDGRKYSIFWTIITGAYMMLFFIYDFEVAPISESVIAITLPIFLGVGYIGSYIFSRRMEDYPGKVEKEYLLIGIAFALTGILIIPFDVILQWFIDGIVIWLGMIILGVYLSLTAPRVFRE